MNAPLLTPPQSKQGLIQFFAAQRSLVDGTLRGFVDEFPDMSEDHWDFLVFLFSCTRGEDGTVWAGTPAAVTYCGFDFASHGIADNSRAARKLLYAPLVKYGFVTSKGPAHRNGACVQVFQLMTAPEPMPDGRIQQGAPFTKTFLRSSSIPFTMLPYALAHEAWRKLSHVERRCITALYGFMTPDGTIVDPNHLRRHSSDWVVSPALTYALGCRDEALVRMLAQLESKGFISTPSAQVAAVDVFPGSQSRLIVDADGQIPCVVVRPALPAPAKRSQTRRAS